jgi:hypothetical protein
MKSLGTLNSEGSGRRRRRGRATIRGARLDPRDALLNSTPLGWACRWGRLDLVTLFLERGADPIEADAALWATPEAWARKMRHDDILAALEAHSH